MYIYFILLTLSIVLAKFVSKKVYFICMYGLLGGVSGLRSVSVGVDTLSYYNIFYHYCNYTVNDAINIFLQLGNNDIEIGFQLFIILCSCISSSAWFMILISSIITYTLYGKFVYSNTNNNNYWMATALILSLGYYYYSIPTIRQAMATAVAIQSIEMISNDKKISAIICVIVATSFHTSALIFLPLIILFGSTRILFYKGYNNCFIFFALTIILSIILFSGLGVLISNVDVISGRLSRYVLHSSIHTLESSNGVYLWCKFILYILVIFLTIKGKNKLINIQKKRMIVYAAFSLMLACIFILLKEYAVIMVRLMYHFDPFSWILIPFVISKLKNVRVRYMCYFTFIIICYLSLYYNSLPGASWESVPYEFIF